MKTFLTWLLLAFFATTPIVQANSNCPKAGNFQGILDKLRIGFDITTLNLFPTSKEEEVSPKAVLFDYSFSEGKLYQRPDGLKSYPIPDQVLFLLNFNRVFDNSI